MKEPKRRHGLGGTVLIMVLTVMAVLIVILMTTLTVVTAANQRIYTKYEENQAYYSARSALDIFISQIIRDDGYYAYNASGGTRTYQYRKEDGSAGTAVMKQGLAMELEFYKVKANNDAGLASNSVYSPAVGAAKNAFTVGSLEDDNYSNDPALESVIYTVKFPSVGNGTNEYGKLADEDASTGYSAATIKVEVDRRIYNFGGPYAAIFAAMTDDQLKACSDGSVSYNGVTYTTDQLIDAIQKGAREKDNIRLKVTSSTDYMGVQGQAVVYIDTTEKPKVNSSRAITSMGGISSNIGAYAFGGASSLSSMKVVNNGTLVGDLYVDGDYEFPDGAGQMHFMQDTVYVIRGNFNAASVKSPMETPFSFDKNGSLLYVGGTMTFGKNGNFGSSSAQANVLAGAIEFAGDSLNNATYYGNMYSNMLIPMNSSNSYSINGNIYTNYVDLVDVADDGSVSMKFGISNFNYAGDGVTALLDLDPFIAKWGMVQVAKGFRLLCPGSTTDYAIFEFDATGTRLEVVDSTDPHYGEYYEFSGTGTITRTPGNKEIYYDYSNTSHYTLNTSTMKKKFQLVAPMAGVPSKSFVELPTAQALYSEILKPGAFINESPDQGHNGDIDTSAASYPTYTGTITEAEAAAYVYYPDPSNIYWFKQASKPENIDGIAKGIITDDNCQAYGYSGQWDGNWTTDKEIAAALLAEKKATDPAYQAALAAYLTIYITGAEKSGAPDPRVLEPGLSEVTLESISAYSGDAEITQAAKDIGAQYSARVISSSGYLKGVNSGIGSDTPYGAVSQSLTPDLTNPVIIDARTNAITIQLGDGSGSSGKFFAGAFIVIGDQPVKVYLPDGMEEYSLGTTDGRSFFISTLDIYKELKKAGGGTLRLGNDSNAMPSPNVYMYSGDNVKKVTLAHKACFLSAHVYIPFAEYNASNNAGIAIQNMTYDGVSINWQFGHSDVGFTVIGSLICGDYITSSSGVAVAYISPDAADYTPGDPIFSWTTNRYARN